MSIDSLNDVIDTLNIIKGIQDINDYTYQIDDLNILDINCLANGDDISQELYNDLIELDTSLGFYLLDQNTGLIDKQVLAKFKKYDFDIKKTDASVEIVGGYSHYIKINDFVILFSY